MNVKKSDSGNWESSQKKNTLHLGYWTIAWLMSMAIAAFGPKFIWDYATLPTVVGVIFNLAVGFGMIMANRRHLQGLDEMHQKIFREAGALTLGVGLVFGLTYELLEDIRLITFEPEISHLVGLMSVTFIGGMIAGKRKYQ